MIDVDIVDDEMEDLLMIDVGCIICLKTYCILGYKIYYSKNIFSKSPAPCGPLPRPQIQAVRGACAIVGAASGVVTGGTVGALDAMQYRK